jgi:hypothetical protein
MKTYPYKRARIIAGALVVGLAHQGALAAESGTWTTREHDGRVEARRGDTLLFAWQSTPLANPIGGEKFKGSAFLHPLCTPSGFQWTDSQPADHLHHFGLWWTWKYLEVDGARFNVWEIQNGQGGHVARSVRQLAGGPDRLEWEFQNDVVVSKPGQPDLTAIHETARVGLAMSGTDAVVIDVALHQRAADLPVRVVENLYSGFSWRGPGSWNKDNSRLTTSEGHGRDDANGTPARWVLCSGPTPNGSASVLLMSAAIDLAGTPEKLRVWDSSAQNGKPFVNFNPVTQTALPLDDGHPAVSKRQYRVVAADRVIDAAAAEAEWRKWLGK